MHKLLTCFIIGMMLDHILKKYYYNYLGSHIDSIPPGTFLLECRNPQNITQTIAHINLTEDNRALLEIEGRCFLACSSHTDIFLNTEVKIITRHIYS